MMELRSTGRSTDVHRRWDTQHIGQPIQWVSSRSTDVLGISSPVHVSRPPINWSSVIEFKKLYCPYFWPPLSTRIASVPLHTGIIGGCCTVLEYRWITVEALRKGALEREGYISSGSCHNSCIDESRIIFFSQTNQNEGERVPSPKEHICTSWAS